MADSLQARIRELAELSVVQQRFVSDVSHELRTPLTTIRLAGDVLYGQRDDFPGPTSRTVELLHTQTDRFERLLADLLEISRYDAGSVTLDDRADQPRAPRGRRDRVDARARPRAAAASSGSSRPGGHLDAEVDPRRIRRIVRNLLGNAIEHGEGRPIVVAVDSNETAIALSVRDYGLGMSEEETARVFDRFWRADPSRTRTIGGTGLGPRDLARGRRRPRRHARRLVAARQGHACSASRCRERRMPRPSCRRCRSSPTTPVPTGPPPHGRGRRGARASTTRSARRCTMRRTDWPPPRHPSPCSSLLLAGCATIPSSGPVQQGDPVPADSSPDLDIVVEGRPPTRRRSRSSRASSRPRRARATTTRWRASTSRPTFADEWQADAARHDRRARRSRDREIVDETTMPGRRHARRLAHRDNGQYEEPDSRTPIPLTTGSSRSTGSGASRGADGHPRSTRSSVRRRCSATTRCTSSIRRTATSCPTCGGSPGGTRRRRASCRPCSPGPPSGWRPGVVVGVPRGRAARTRRRAGVGRRRERRRSPGAAFDDLATVQRMQEQLDASLIGGAQHQLGRRSRSNGVDQTMRRRSRTRR